MCVVHFSLATAISWISRRFIYNGSYLLLLCTMCSNSAVIQKKKMKIQSPCMCFRINCADFAEVIYNQRKCAQFPFTLIPLHNGPLPSPGSFPQPNLQNFFSITPLFSNHKPFGYLMSLGDAGSLDLCTWRYVWHSFLTGSLLIAWAHMQYKEQ